MSSFNENNSIREFQKYVYDVYSVLDDRQYSSAGDLLNQQQRFAMRALKGIRKENSEKIKLNLLISFSWFISICNRLHIDIENEIWSRFPYKCSYCGSCPCSCKISKPDKRLKVSIDENLRPKSLAEFQEMFNAIYPASGRSITDAGVHLAEEVGEVSEAIHNFINQHKGEQFDEVKLEMADLASCVFGLANSVPFDIAKELSVMCKNGCHNCHKTPCECSFIDVLNFKT